MRWALALLLCVHGVIHLLGVAKEWQLAALPAMSGATTLQLPAAFSKTVGTLWLGTCVALLVAAALVLTRSATWWVCAAAAVVCSQLLVVYAWPDAKAGTLANLLLALAIAVAWAQTRFERESDARVQQLFASQPAAQASVVTRDELAQLPPPVRAWLEHAGIVGKPRALYVRLQQRGQMRVKQGGAFFPADATQYFSVTEPGFVWRVKIPMFHVPVVGRDSYLAGKGRMLIKGAGLVPIVDSTGEQIDQGTLLRFLGELVWFPSAALAAYVRWSPLDASSARATMTYRGVTASADYFFDAQSRVQRMAAMRYSDSEHTLEPWIVSMKQWKPLAGVLAPSEGEVSWRLPSGDFTYYRWEITALDQNLPQLYEAAQ